MFDLKEMLHQLHEDGWVLSGKRSFQKKNLEIEFVEMNTVRILGVDHKDVIEEEFEFVSSIELTRFLAGVQEEHLDVN